MIIQFIYRQLKNRNISLLFVLFCLSVTHATWAGGEGFDKSFHPIFALGAGASYSSETGISQHIPIQNPVTDEFYLYFANNRSQSVGWLDILLAVEWNLNPLWKMQTGIDYNRKEPFNGQGKLVQGADLESADTYIYNYKVSTSQILLNAKLLYTIKDIFHPYLFTGIGTAFNKAYQYNTNVPPTLTFTRVYRDNTNTTFTYALGLGIDTNVTANLRVGIGYRYTELGKILLGNAVIDTTPVPHTLSRSKVHANEFLGQLTWIF